MLIMKTRAALIRTVVCIARIELLESVVAVRRKKLLRDYDGRATRGHRSKMKTHVK